MSKNSSGLTVLERVSSIIIDKRNGFFLVYILLVIFCLFSRGWVSVNNVITDYLPGDTETRMGVELMDNEFTTFGTANIMVSNITLTKGEDIKDDLVLIEGVNEVVFDNDQDHFKNASGLFTITFDEDSESERTVGAMDGIRELLAAEDVYISSEIGVDSAKELASEIGVVLIIAAFIIVGVLLFTSKTYMEIPVLIVTFLVAAVLNMGTHFIYGEISFISNSIAVVLQLALAIDYAIILCHRFTEEREVHQAREAAIQALSKAIPEISSSSMTTISSLMALMFMKFGLGFDMGLVLIKALLFSLLAVFTLMPGLLMVFSGLMDKSVHKNFVPQITKWGNFVVKSKWIVPPMFIVVLIIAFLVSNQTNYVFGYTTLSTIKQSDRQIAGEKIEDTYGTTNILAVVIPSGDYDKEQSLIRKLESLPVVKEALGLSNQKINDQYFVTDKLNPRKFAELTDLDIEVSNMLYRGYAIEQETYGKLVNGLADYQVPLVDMFDFLYKQMEEDYVALDSDLKTDINDLNEKLTRGKAQLKSDAYSRIILLLDMPEEGEAAFSWLDQFHEIAYEYYDEVYLVGKSTSNSDLASFFETDNMIISILSALFVMFILLFTFKSAGLPVLLVLTIQGSIWINFSFPVIQGINIFFMSYLVVTSIQMGATIDYAIVITSRFMELKKSMEVNDAMVEALNQAFPTIITSGTILASAGLLIGRLSSDYAISSIGTCLGRGTIVSLILVMGVLPQTLLFGNTIIEKTAFVLKRPGLIVSSSGTMKLNGKLQGYVTGYIDAEIKGTIKGDVKGMVEMGNEQVASIKGVEKEIINEDIK